MFMLAAAPTAAQSVICTQPNFGYDPVFSFSLNTRCFLSGIGGGPVLTTDNDGLGVLTLTFSGGYTDYFAYNAPLAGKGAYYPQAAQAYDSAGRGVGYIYDKQFGEFRAPNISRIDFFGGIPNYITNIRTGVIVGAVPEPNIWLLFIAGFGALGYALRRQNTVVFARGAGDAI
ncbi:PEP-CTERM sorting domain-containing protein [Sphingomonas sp.]|uniref:PEP-CTERM sorting domain-containing protein n=1 Tax=Sphingomonas sp. TaxID=28214 RepID=UPI003CC640ED